MRTRLKNNPLCGLFCFAPDFFNRNAQPWKKDDVVEKNSAKALAHLFTAQGFKNHGVALVGDVGFGFVIGADEIVKRFFGINKNLKTQGSPEIKRLYRFLEDAGFLPGYGTFDCRKVLDNAGSKTSKKA